MEVPSDGIVHLGVRHAEVPQTPPAELSEWVRPAGEIVGWRLEGAAVLQEAARRQIEEQADPAGGWLHDITGAFADWRGTWLEVAPLGPLRLMAELEALIAAWELDANETTTILGSLRSGDVPLGAGTAVAVISQISDLADLLRERGTTGAGIYAVGDSTRLVGGFALVGPDRVVGSAGDTTVVSGDAVTVVDASGTWRPGGWQLSAEGVAVTDADSGQVRHLSWEEGAALTQLAPGALTVELRPTPLTAIFADVIMTLTGTLAGATAAGRPVVVFTA